MIAVLCGVLLVLVAVADATIRDSGNTNITLCIGAAGSTQSKPLPRRYDISDLGYDEYFQGWADVQGQGAANDYCRVVAIKDKKVLACALAGTQGESDINYLSSTTNFDRGYTKTWYMKDEDGDGRDDYCRCVGNGGDQQVVCTKAGENGFFGSTAQGGKDHSFTPTGTLVCNSRKVRPEFGRVSGFVLQ